MLAALTLVWEAHAEAVIEVDFRHRVWHQSNYHYVYIHINEGISHGEMFAIWEDWWQDFGVWFRVRATCTETKKRLSSFYDWYCTTNRWMINQSQAESARRQAYLEELRQLAWGPLSGDS